MLKYRRLLALVALLLLMFSMVGTTALAAAEPETPEEPVDPEDPYIDLRIITAYLNISSGTAYCSGTASTWNTSDKIYLTMSLKRLDGTTIGTWTTSGKGSVSLSRYRYVSSGYTYYVAVTATVYTSSGSYVESITVWSGSKSC